MKIALLGATGFVGRTAAAALAARPGVRELLLVDYDVRAAKKSARSLSPKCRWAMADAGRTPDLDRLLHEVDAAARVTEVLLPPGKQRLAPAAAHRDR